MTSAIDQERLQEAYERGIELAENFDYEYEDLVGVIHGGDHDPPEDHPAHWVEAAVELEVLPGDEYDPEPYANTTVRQLLTEARDLGLVPTMLNVRVGYEAQEYRTKPDPSGQPTTADVDALVIIEFGLEEELD